MSPSPAHPVSRPRRPPRTRVLLVLAVLVGLLGMHGLAGAAAPTPGHGVHDGDTHHGDTHYAHHGSHHGALHGAHAMEAAEAGEPYICHPEDGRGGTHGGHADRVCASGAVPGGAMVPALALSVSGGPATSASAVSPAWYAPSGGRAPPSLAELQLLRI
ncbi:DUF6153 family protein [Streptomyces sp. GC420]|uniref:DUF6153 family protein n=1 Tax=Streptomyces sp. GC420 TaxID=2697568 RepID=UPI0028BDDDEF|nr:DUF6153 family protein [Streptomyces sp. GC420]